MPGDLNHTRDLSVSGCAPDVVSDGRTRIEWSLMWRVVLVLLGGCQLVFELKDDLDAPIPEDAPLDAPVCFGTDPVRVCLLAPPSAPRVIDTDQQLDTSSLCPPYDDPAEPFCVLSATDITISKRLQVIGSKPLVLVATGTITILGTGELDLSSKRLGTTGPATEPLHCTPLSVSPTGGGPGGTFGGRGGAGGGRLPGGAVTASRFPTPIGFTGGCAGVNGAAGPEGGSGGAGGAGGGAGYLIASTIQIDGILDASGAGGSGGIATAGTFNGGGGGGAGGLIGLEASVIHIGPMAHVFANGGGGGEAAGGAVGIGVPGADPSVGSSGQSATGGAGNFMFGGDGGDGAGGMTLAGAAGGSLGDGGGGGGGGAGVIWMTVTPTIETGSVVSPAATAP